MVGTSNNSAECNVVSVLPSGEVVSASFSAPTKSTVLRPGPPAWSNYVKGVVANFPGKFMNISIGIRLEGPCLGSKRT